MLSHIQKKINMLYADDDRETVGTLFKLRAPTLFIGLIFGVSISFAASRFEEVLIHNIQVAFFLPFIVYLANAVGTQTETIYARDLKTGKAKFINYFHKELALGLIFGLVFGAFSGIMAFLWLKNDLLAFSVATSSFLAISVAPLLALFITHIMQRIHEDPAVGSGPVATVIQDTISIIIYGVVSSIIIL